MSIIGDWLYGPKRTPGAIGIFLRSYEVNASTLFSIMDSVDTWASERTPVAREVPQPGTYLRQQSTGAVISRERVMAMNAWELRGLRIANDEHGVFMDLGAPVVAGPDNLSPEGAWTHAVELIESKSKPLARPGRIISLALWIPVLIAIAAAGAFAPLAWQAALLGVAVAVLAVVVAVLGMTQVARIETRWKQSYVRPLTWVQLGQRRVTLWVGIGTGVGGAAVGTLVTALVTAWLRLTP